MTGAAEGGEPRAPRKSKKSPVRVEILAPPDYSAWEAFVRETPGGAAYNLASYLHALCEAGGGTFRVAVGLRGDEIVGGVAYRERSTPAGTLVSRRLLLYYNGLVLRDYETRYPSERTTRRLAVVDALAAELEGRRYGRLELHSRSAFDDARGLMARGWEVKPSYTYVVPLHDLDAQWNRVEQNLRRLVERGRSQGLALTIDERFEEFHRLHALTSKRKGVPLYLPADAFALFYERLRALGLARLYHAQLPDGRVAATQLVLLGHDVTHTVCAAADPDLQSTGANAFLRWCAFEDLANLGHTANDLTDAAVGPVARFKSQLGGRLETALVATRPETLAVRAQQQAIRVSSGMTAWLSARGRKGGA